MARDVWAADELADAAGGVWSAPPPAAFRAFGVSIDTRELAAGAVFVALQGERTDGHDHLVSAHAAGASAAVVQRVPDEAPRGLSLLVVPDPVAALQAMARVWRERLRAAGTRVIAVTGSNGKTTCVRFIHAALRPTLTGGHAPKSFNNHLGVPITLLNARPGDDYVICEIGMNAPGEIEHLTGLASPDVCAITSIGRAHVGGLVDGSAGEADGLARVAREKWSLFTASPAEATRVTTHAVMDVVERTGVRAALAVPDAVTIAAAPAEIRQDEAGVEFSVESVRARAPMVGRHNAQNGALALTVARAMGVRAAVAAEGLAHAEGPPMRLAVERLASGDGTITLLNDAYNANPDSVLAAIETLASMDSTGARIAVLGDMLELGPGSEAMHAEVGARAGEAGIDGVWAFGPESAAAARAARAAGVGDVRHEASVEGESLTGWARAVKPGDVVLVKGSRGVRLERFVRTLHEAARAGAHANP